MKHLKTGVAALALVGGLTFALATNGMKRTDPTEKWFLYQPTLPGGEANPENYVPTPNNGQDVPSCNSQTQNLCAIRTQPQQADSMLPNLDIDASQTRFKP